MTVIVTGAAGFIGCHAAARFRDRGADVVAVDNLSRPGARQNLQWLTDGGGVTFVEADIRDAGAMLDVVGGHPDTELVLHAAGQVAVTTSVTDPRLDFEVNALGTFNVLEAVRLRAPEAAFFLTSTNKVYGGLEDLSITEVDGRYTFAERPQGVSEDQPLDFHSPYGCSKGSADQYTRDYHRIFGIRTVVFRQSCVYGTRQFGIEDQGWIAWFVIASTLGRPVTIYGDGKQVRDVLWIDDLVDLFVTAHENIDRCAGEVFNVGGGVHRLSLWDLVAELSRTLGREVEPGMADWRPGDQRVYISDTTKVERALGWHPGVAPRAGIARLAEWAGASRPLLEEVIG
ncbi:MAG: CDP-paratose 2-epimerase [Chloroflexota bacterium]|nr:CDP-paratose 2-epimerase [Chloroflexota bacterium]